MNSTLDLISVLALVALACGFVWRRYGRSRKASGGGACGKCGQCDKE